MLAPTRKNFLLYFSQNFRDGRVIHDALKNSISSNYFAMFPIREAAIHRYYRSLQVASGSAPLLLKGFPIPLT